MFVMICGMFLGTNYIKSRWFPLDTSVVPPLIYAVMGSSRDIAIGPVAVVSLLLSSMIQKVADPSVDPNAYKKLVFTATFFAGIFQASLGLFRWISLSLLLISFNLAVMLRSMFNMNENMSCFFCPFSDWVFWWTFFHMLPLLASWEGQQSL